MQRALVLLSLAAPAAAVFTPQTNNELKTAVNACLNEDSTGVTCVEYGAIGTWDTKQITSMNHLFAQKREFNADISAWDTSNVISMDGMFEGATSFNQDISSWNVKQVTRSSYMFSGASAFQQDLSKWNMENNANPFGMFDRDNYTPVLCGCSWVEQKSSNDYYLYIYATIAAAPCHDFEYADPDAAPSCYNSEAAAQAAAEQAEAEEAARQAIRPLIRDYPNIVSEEWAAKQGNCGS